MTIMNAFILGQEAVVLTDTISVDIKTGAINMKCSKLITLPQIPAVISVRGAIQALSMVAEEIYKRDIETIEDVEHLFANELRQATDRHFSKARETSPWVAIFDVCAVGWSRVEKRHKVLFVSSSDVHPAPPWVVKDLGAEIVIPGPDLSWIKGSFNVRIHGAGIVQRQRELIGPPMMPGCPAPVLAGGKIELTTVTRRVITTEVIGRWPGDVIGAIPDRTEKPFLF